VKNHPLYKKLKQIALDGHYTIEQVRSASISQVTTLLETSHFSSGFLYNMKRLLISELQDRQDERDTHELRQVAMTWLNANFPDWQAERGREGDKPYVTIWLKGKPNGSDDI